MTAKPLHVLLIEDSQGEARLIRELLSDTEGFAGTTEVVDRLSTGLSRLAEGEFDVVLLDLSLPDSQGLEGVDAIHAQSPTVPVVVLTGRTDRDLALEAVRRGAEDYLLKGVPSGQELLSALRIAMERHRHRKVETVVTQPSEQG